MKNILAITALSFALILTGCGEPTLSAEGEAAVNYLTNYNYLKDNCEIDSMEDLGMAMGVVMVSPVLLAELGQDKEGNEEFLTKRQA
ncbi:hypothetical protein [Agarivorans sp. DSG3-1]|uniref:hypothetical protein n=1 Tax=Agarivorans sp. DSG3-1 TaxID=3342249 RepID=UPI00398F5A63